MARMKRSRRLPDEYNPHAAQFIRPKLTMRKFKNLDKARGGKVMATELLRVAIESDDMRDRAFKLRPLVSSTLIELHAQTIQDD
uniref:Uncharacterized protein n=1 Tax=Cannabis sativa TaxID=3483 RepID=A0A803PBT4_CANSA